MLMNSGKEISNLEFPIAKVIRQELTEAPSVIREEILQTLSEDDFVSQQVDIYLQELETAMHAGYDELGAKEIAIQECLRAIRKNNGEVFEA